MPATLAAGRDDIPARIEPDLDFIRSLRELGGETLKKCMQCGTCSAACELSPDTDPFPRKEMIWAAWGMKDRLLKDPDVWLCHQCNDCSTRCPRGARPGDVLAAIRQQSLLHYAVPGFLARWMNHPKYIPLLLAIPTVLLGLTLLSRERIEPLLGITRQAGERIVYSYSSHFPHALLNAFFLLFSALVFIVMLAGVLRFWRAMKSCGPRPAKARGKGVFASILSTVKTVFMHQKFAQCTTASSRFISHFLVLFGFLALTAVTLWVITAKYNPLIRDIFVYPFSFWSPWKLLANLGGLLLIAGLVLMVVERLLHSERVGVSTYFDWALIGQLFLVVLSGFGTEVLHYLRLEPHRHVAYFVHLVFVFVVLMYLPYSKLAHLVYRGVAMVCAEHTGRHSEAKGDV